jgi:AcrR family transcriptional regulator
MVRIVKKPDVRRAEIIKAARDLFQTRDYEHTTMQDVMDELDIAKGTIYHYFKSKEELLEAVIQDIVDQAVDYMQSVVDNAGGNALEKIQLLVAAGKMAQENDKILEQIHHPGSAGMHVRLLAVTFTKQAPLYAKLFQQGCDEGLFQTETPLESAEFILTAIQFLTDQGISSWSDEDLYRRAKAIPVLIERILNAKPGSFRFLLSQIS